jgi:hypothetical protein
VVQCRGQKCDCLFDGRNRTESGVSHTRRDVQMPRRLSAVYALPSFAPCEYGILQKLETRRERSNRACGVWRKNRRNHCLADVQGRFCAALGGICAKTVKCPWRFVPKTGRFVLFCGRVILVCGGSCCCSCVGGGNGVILWRV